MKNETIFLLGFFLLIIILLVFDLGLMNKKKDNDKVSLKQAGLMSFFVIMLSLGFYFFLSNFGYKLHSIETLQDLQRVIVQYKHPVKIIPGDLEASIERYNHNLGLEYLTGYILEYSLSVDNIFVILLIFSSFNVPKRNYHRVLFWGVLGAIVLRFLFIFIGATLMARFEWIMYVFGVFLVYTGIKMLFDKGDEESIDTANHPVVKFANKYFKVHHSFVGNKFFIRIDGVRKMTPLFLVLVIVEFTDLIFAVDSIPAIFSVTKDPYIVFFSNIFAIIGLRSMFFLLAGIVDKFRYLKVGLAILLTFIGIKMLLGHYALQIGLTTSVSLFIILGILGISVLASLLIKEKR